MDISKRNIDKKVEEIKSKYKIIKVIDFNCDIDKEKSGYYILDDKNQEIEFIYQKKADLLDYPLINMFTGEKILSNDYLELKPDIKAQINDNQEEYFKIYHSDYFFKDDDIVHIKLDKGLFIDKMFRIDFLSDNFLTSYKNNILDIHSKYGIMKFHKIKYEARKYGTFILNGEDISFWGQKFNDTEILSSFFIELKGEKIDFILDKELNQYKWSCDQWEKSEFLDSKEYIKTSDDLKDMNRIMLQSIGIWKEEIKLEKESIIIGERKGYIYLNELKLPDEINRLKVFIISKGKCLPQIKLKDGGWIDFNENLDKSLLDEKICLRFYTETYTKVRKIFIINE